ncbi:MAG: TfoX/Sxy family protein [Polyangiaceae bacterium]|nr:TfoX/Sxy family protein [Polyangiaceae bacterium]
MAKHGTFAAYLEETLAPLGNVTTRAMFGGHNIAKDGVTFGLIVDDVLYLKVDDVNKPDFVAKKLGPFTYHRDGKAMPMSYHRAPDGAEDWETLEPWVRGSLAAALRAKKASPKKTAAKKTAAKKVAKKKRA